MCCVDRLRPPPKTVSPLQIASSGVALVSSDPQAIAQHDLKEVVPVETEDARRVMALSCKGLGNFGPKSVVAGVGEFIGSVANLDNRIGFHSAPQR